jgi:hypothetical protein
MSRLQEPLPTTTDEATRETASPDASEGINPLTTDNDDANTDPVTDTQPNAGGATPATGNWPLKEETRNEYKTDWAAISALVPGRKTAPTRRECDDSEWELKCNQLKEVYEETSGLKSKSRTTLFLVDSRNRSTCSEVTSLKRSGSHSSKN